MALWYVFKIAYSKIKLLFQAVNKVCIVNSHILHERVPQNVYSHEIQVDAENFGRISLPIIDDFLERMELKNTYKISIYNAVRTIAST